MLLEISNDINHASSVLLVAAAVFKMTNVVLFPRRRVVVEHMLDGAPFAESLAGLRKYAEFAPLQTAIHTSRAPGLFDR
jgi:hypothetical protein